MATIYFNLSTFRKQFPALSSITDENAQLYWNNATLYIYDKTGGCYFGAMRPDQQSHALYLMTAHLAQLSILVSTNQVAGVLSSASVDKVSIAMTPPPVPNQWQYWLQSTPYGQQLLALLQVASAGGYYFGGRPEINAFRRGGFAW